MCRTSARFDRHFVSWAWLNRISTADLLEQASRSSSTTVALRFLTTGKTITKMGLMVWLHKKTQCQLWCFITNPYWTGARKLMGVPTSPFFKYWAAPRVFIRTARGLQLNLYLSAFAEHSGAGRPPQYDTNDKICTKAGCYKTVLNMTSATVDC